MVARKLLFTKNKRLSSIISFGLDTNGHENLSKVPAHSVQYKEKRPPCKPAFRCVGMKLIGDDNDDWTICWDIY